MKYWNYVDFPNWKKHQADLIQFRNDNPPSKEYYEEFARLTPPGDPVIVSWYAFTDVEIQKGLPNLFNEFKNFGMDVRQMIFFINAPNDETVIDATDKRCPFIHVDSRDEAEWEETQFDPTFAFNIPLENCENSYTLFYESKNGEIRDIYYPNFYLCGGVDPRTVTEVDRFQLSRPAILRVNVPHSVVNPTNDYRYVATFRFYNDIERLLTDE